MGGQRGGSGGVRQREGGIEGEGEGGGREHQTEKEGERL